MFTEDASPELLAELATRSCVAFGLPLVPGFGT